MLELDPKHFIAASASSIHIDLVSVSRTLVEMPSMPRWLLNLRRFCVVAFVALGVLSTAYTIAVVGSIAGLDHCKSRVVRIAKIGVLTTTSL